MRLHSACKEQLAACKTLGIQNALTAGAPRSLIQTMGYG